METYYILLLVLDAAFTAWYNELSSTYILNLSQKKGAVKPPLSY